MNPNPSMKMKNKFTRIGDCKTLNKIREIRKSMENIIRLFRITLRLVEVA